MVNVLSMMMNSLNVGDWIIVNAKNPTETESVCSLELVASI